MSRERLSERHTIWRTPNLCDSPANPAPISISILLMSLVILFFYIYIYKKVTLLISCFTNLYLFGLPPKSCNRLQKLCLTGSKKGDCPLATTFWTWGRHNNSNDLYCFFLSLINILISDFKISKYFRIMFLIVIEIKHKSLNKLIFKYME